MTYTTRTIIDRLLASPEDGSDVDMGVLEGSGEVVPAVASNCQKMNKGYTRKSIAQRVTCYYACTQVGEKIRTRSPYIVHANMCNAAGTQMYTQMGALLTYSQ